MRRESYPCVPIVVPWRVHRAFFVLPCTLFDPSAQDKERGSSLQSARSGSYLLVRGGMRRPGAAPVRGPVRLLTASSGPRCWTPPKEEGLLPCRSVLARCRTACFDCPNLRVD
ncbi:hypothetical protein NDU88_001919 [Pleurodeles waltl]|uniref:Uncharacterized protein n=1 Tax=Pleurodeles waltl TaxID=8319 RepID=A0AAV7VCV9_PLEWA|nr:hypothetical protein NDU88_001919 [Pleurodeles waltl]